MIPDFIQDMAILDDDIHVVGTFHLGELYNIKKWADSNQPNKSLIEAYSE
jgi:DNA-binding transcriptional regulator/RsmH inhibitor MraZ